MCKDYGNQLFLWSVDPIMSLIQKCYVFFTNLWNSFKTGTVGFKSRRFELRYDIFTGIWIRPQRLYKFCCGITLWWWDTKVQKLKDFLYVLNHTKDFNWLWLSLPSSEWFGFQKFFLNAYQSYIWNSCTNWHASKPTGSDCVLTSNQKIPTFALVLWTKTLYFRKFLLSSQIC